MLDPAAGNGALLRSLIDLALDTGVAVGDLPVSNLFAYDVQERFLTEYRHMLGRLGVILPSQNTVCTNFLESSLSLQADIVVMNPPWAQFGNLPASFRTRLAPLFKKYDLIENLQKALLGSSRCDVAALFVARAMVEQTSQDAEVHAFLPAALFFGDGASRGFRRYIAGSTTYQLLRLYDLDRCDVFPETNARSCVAHFSKIGDQKYPIPLLSVVDGRSLLAEPYADAASPLRVIEDRPEKVQSSKRARLVLAKPRQGVNTCGANDILLFSNIRRVDSDHVLADSRIAANVLIPRHFLHPFVFQDSLPQNKRRFVLLCYDNKSGRALSRADLEVHAELWGYLLLVRDRLLARRGTLIQGTMNENRWWTLLGVGPYCFKAHKVVWRAFGARRFEPVLASSNDDIVSQGNQALHASISFESEVEALEVLEQISGGAVCDELDSLRSRGLPSFAQPGRIKMVLERLFEVEYK